MPAAPAPPGWRWSALSALARLESGHTPSRNHAEYWGGDVPWISLPDAKANHGRRIVDTLEHTNALGIANSSARVLPEGTVCLSRTASVGYVTVMDRPMATSQDFVNWVCSDRLDPDFLKYLLLSEGRAGLLRFASGAVHQTIYFPEAKAFHICHPDVDGQRRIVDVLDKALEGIAAARVNAERNLRNARALVAQRLQAAFFENNADWTDQPISAIAVHSLGKMLDKVKNRGERRPYLRNVNVRWFGFDLSDVAEMRFTEDEESRYTAVRGDLLVCEGGEPGRAAIWAGDEPIHFQKALHRVRCYEPAHNAWLLHFLYAMHSSGRLRRHLTGTGIQHLTGEALGRLRVPIAPSSEVSRLLAEFEELRSECLRLEAIYLRKLAALDELQQSLLHRAFTGQLTSTSPRPTPSPSWRRPMSPADRHAGILAIAYKLHEAAGRTATFGHVKAEKIAHMVEAHLGIDLGRAPVKDAAGPNDFARLKQVEQRARQSGQFDFVREDGGNYRFVPLDGLDQLAERTRDDLGAHAEHVDRLVGLMLPMRTFAAEIFATTYAAWNNLLLDGRPATDEAIVREAREDWHPDKLRIPRERFFRAIAWMREHGVTPEGRGKRVSDKPPTSTRG
jgi:type I restriction enzyme S subunit